MTLEKFGNVDLAINRDSIVGWGLKLLPIVKKLAWFLPILIFIAFFVFYFAKLVAFFLWALAVWLLLRIMGIGRGYMYSYRVTIYAQTLAILLTAVPLVSWIFGTWYMSLVVTLLVVWFNLRQKEVSPQVN